MNEMASSLALQLESRVDSTRPLVYPAVFVVWVQNVQNDPELN
jgi:hypothetical protein